MKGWVFDVYPSSENELTIWFKTEDGKVRMFKDSYYPAFYLEGSSENLEELKSKLEEHESVRKLSFENRRTNLRDEEPSRVLRIECDSIKGLQKFAGELVRLGGYRGYRAFNVDLSPAQRYLHERGIFPFAKVSLSDIFDPSFDLLDSARSTDYDFPPLNFAELSVEADTRAEVPSFEDPIKRISLSFEEESRTIKKGGEVEKILGLVQLIRERDPDIVLTSGGDGWDIPYLGKRAKYNEVLDELILGREAKPLEVRDESGTSYFSYGKVYYKPPSHHLKGRIHIDTQNSFIYQECGLEGLIELSRVTRTPIQKMARSSIGSAMTNLQLYFARKKGILIPWTKSEPEEFKNGLKLIEADRGGVVFEPRVGAHEDVGEIDFSSFYPAIMRKYNISPETVLCDCCPDSSNKVPDLEYNICENKEGLIPQILAPVLKKRNKYKKLTKNADTPNLSRIYEARQEALKWILVTCFGYLGYRNAKFGRVEAHEAVTAFARKGLRKASRIAEEEGFDVVHGIVDSLWVKKSGVEKSELESLCNKIEKKLDLSISPEGRYKWIVFPAARGSNEIPAMNRYYGLFESGEVEARGIMMRREDSPELIKNIQNEVLEKLSTFEGLEKLEDRIPDVLSAIRKYVENIEQGNIDIKNLTIRKQLSQSPDSYESKSRSAMAATRLMEEGVKLHPGQQVEYIVVDAKAKNPRFRVEPVQTIEREKRYDTDWYLEKVFDALEELLNPFGYTKEKISSCFGGERRQERLFHWDRYT